MVFNVCNGRAGAVGGTQNGPRHRARAVAAGKGVVHRRQNPAVRLTPHQTLLCFAPLRSLKVKRPPAEAWT